MKLNRSYAKYLDKTGQLPKRNKSYFLPPMKDVTRNLSDEHVEKQDLEEVALDINLESGGCNYE